MEYQGKNKSPYKGVFGTCLIMTVIPIALYFIVYLIVTKFTNQPKQLNVNFSLMIGVGCGFIFQLSCVLAGLLKGTFSVVINRVKEFFSNLTINFKFAIKYYWDDIKSEGVVFWIYFLLMGTTLTFFLIGLINSYIFYINYK